jgi:hypothetical protein
MDDFLKNQSVSQEEKNKMLRILKRSEEESTKEDQTFNRMKNEDDEWTEEDEFFEKLAESEMNLNGNFFILKKIFNLKF